MSELIATVDLKIDEDTSRLVKSYESYERFPYQGKADSAGVWTVGYGHVLSSEEKKSQIILVADEPINVYKQGLSKDQAAALLHQDIEKRCPRLRERIPFVRKPSEFGMWVSVNYNLEMPLVKTPGQRWRDGNYFGAMEYLPRYHYSAKKPRLGLVRRRWSEVLFGCTGEILKAGNKKEDAELLEKLRRLGFKFEIPASLRDAYNRRKY